MLDTINDEIFYSPEELAKRFKISLSSIYKLIRSGEIPSIRLGKVYRIPNSELGRYLQRQQRPSLPKPLIPEAAKKFIGELRKWKWQERIKEVYLYGSYARGDFDEDSDIDICVIVDKIDQNIRNLISSGAEKAMFDMDYQELLSVREESLLSWERMKKGNYPLAQNILREGIPLWKSH